MGDLLALETVARLLHSGEMGCPGLRNLPPSDRRRPAFPTRGSAAGTGEAAYRGGHDEGQYMRQRAMPRGTRPRTGTPRRGRMPRPPATICSAVPSGKQREQHVLHQLDQFRAVPHHLSGLNRYDRSGLSKLT